MPLRKLLGRSCSLPARSPARCSTAGAAATPAERVHLHFDDGSMVSIADDAPEASGCSRWRATLLLRR